MRVAAAGRGVVPLAAQRVEQAGIQPAVQQVPRVLEVALPVGVARRAAG